MRLGIHTITINRRFSKALRRVHPQIDDLKVRLRPIELTGRYNDVMLTFVDDAASVIRVTKRGKADDIFEVDVGYDFGSSYPPEDDVLVIQLIEAKLKQIVDGDPGFEAKRAELQRVITAWTSQSVGA